MPKTITIELGGREFHIREFTLGQLEQLHECVLRQFAAPASDEGNQAWWERNYTTLLIALGRDYPTVSLADLKATEVGTIQRVREIIESILLFAGLILRAAPAAQEGQSASGEAAAPA